jgi:hypothetical protein
MGMMPSAKNNRAQEGPQNHPRRGFARPLADDALRETAAALSQAGFADPTLVLRWAEIVGPEVARVAEPVKLQEGPDGAVLTLKSEPGAAVFLQHETRALVERLNSYLGANRIARIKLVSGNLPERIDSPEHPALHLPQGGGSEGEKELRASLERFTQLRKLSDLKNEGSD